MTAHERLREADPLVSLRDEIDVDAPPPQDVLDAIVAMPRKRSRARGWPRRVAIVAAAVLIAAIGVTIALPGDRQPNLAAKAYAAMSPTDSILHVVEITRYTRRNPSEAYWPGGGKPPRAAWCCGSSDDESRRESWQRGKEAHAIIRARYSWAKRGRVEVSESTIGEDDAVRYLSADRKVQTVRPGEGSRSERRALREGLAAEFRDRYAEHRLRDAGTAIFNGRPARRYVVEHPTRRFSSAMTTLPYVVTTETDEQYFLDRATGRPLGSVKRDVVRRPNGSAFAESRLTTTVARIEQLDPTPANLAKLRPDWSAFPKVTRPRRDAPGSRPAPGRRARKAARS